MSVSVPGAATTAAPTALILDVEVRKRGHAHALPMDISPGGGAGIIASRQVAGGGVCELAGFMIWEFTNEFTARFSLWDGTSTSGQLLATAFLPIAGGVVVGPEFPGIHVATGKVFIQILSGTVSGVIFYR